MSRFSKSAANLIHNVSEIRRNARACGLEFNIFKILERSEKEETHTRMLQALLCPSEGCQHGQGALFLREFLEVLKLSFNADGALVEKEVIIEEGGRIDLVITDAHSPSRQIFIENKIHAEEQEDQVGRYHDENQSAEIIFLTLSGHGPLKIGSATRPELTEKLHCASYRIHIIEWLSRCSRHVSSNHPLREAIHQYQSIIKNTLAMEDILKSILKNSETHRAWRELIEKKDLIEKSIRERLEHQIKAAGLNLGLERIIHPRKGKKGDPVYLPVNPSLKALGLGIFLDNFNDDEQGDYTFNFGIFSSDPIPSQRREGIIKLFRKEWIKADPRGEKADGLIYIVWMSEKMPASSLIDGDFENVRLPSLLGKLLAIAEAR